jgi:hypothetical protein
MNQILIYTSVRSQAIEAFKSLQFKAFIGDVRARWFGCQNRLEDFAGQKIVMGLTPRYLGIQDIPIEKIIGSVGRKDDFDQQFRPLKGNLQDRWINIFVHQELDDLPAINVYQVGEFYFVEDGHHRVSTARYLGRKYVQAEVRQYTQQITCTFCCAATRSIEARRVTF